MLAINVSLFFTQLMNGIGNGAVYASLALALVLIFRTTGILNFAQGEMALYSTYLFWYFADQGLPVIVAILLSMVLSFIGGALIERVVIRPVEHSSPLVIVIVTIGLFLALEFDRAGAVRLRHQAEPAALLRQDDVAARQRADLGRHARPRRRARTGRVLPALSPVPAHEGRPRDALGRVERGVDRACRASRSAGC